MREGTKTDFILLGIIVFIVADIFYEKLRFRFIFSGALNIFPGKIR